MLRSQKVLFIFVCLMVSACSKEWSAESGLSGIIPENCTVSQVMPMAEDGTTALGSYNVIFKDHEPYGVTVYDSTTNNTVFTRSAELKDDSLKLSKDEYFLLDAKGRIKELVIKIDVGGNDEEYRFTYLYDNQGYLISKEWYLLSISERIPAFVYNYSWQNGNLVKTEVREGSGDKRLAMQAEITYSSEQAKDYLYCFPESNELAPYIMMLNVGEKSTKLFNKITVNIYDADGTVVETYLTTYTGYRLNTQGYVEQVLATGDVVDGLPMIHGLTKFRYDCK